MTRQKRRDEQDAAAALERYMNDRLNFSDVRVVPNEHDPPDYWLDVHDKRFAIEVTAIADDHPHRPGTSIIGYWNNVSHLQQKVREQSIRQGILNGHYTLRVRGHPEIHPRRRQIQKDAFEFMASTKNQIQGGPEILHKDAGGTLEIEKRDFDIRILNSIGTTVQYEAEDKLAGLFQKSAHEKRRKLGIKNIKPEEAILIFVDAYRFATFKTWSAAIAQAAALREFHGVFWLPVMSGEKPRFLFSREREWLHDEARSYQADQRMERNRK